MTALIETLDVAGDGAVMVRYLGHVGVFRVTIPQDAPSGDVPLSVTNESQESPAWVTLSIR